MNIEDAIQETINRIDTIVESKYPIRLAECAELVFESMGTEPTDRGWSENSENTKKKVGALGKFHRNVDTGFLMEYASTPGMIVDDDWLDRMPDSEKYKYANELGRFDDIGRTKQDEIWIEQKLEMDILEGLK